MKKSKLQKNMRVYHRYLGFFLAGIMAVYALSGILMIFRNTDFLKKEVVQQQTLPPETPAEELGALLRIKNFKVEKQEGSKVYFNGGSFDQETGLANVTRKELPYLLKKMTDMHKATSDRPLFFLNIFFGSSLFFFVLSSFWMFLPKTSIFKKGMYFALAGLALALLVIFV
jgi:hypothetical protein